MNISFILTFLIALVVLYVILKILSFPIKLIIKLLINALAGGIIIFLINFFSASIGVTIALNWINALVVGILGIPGAIILFVIQLF